MGIITIARYLGAGETTIAPALAARLGWKVADHSILNRESEITGVSLPHAARWDEHDPTFAERLHGLAPEFANFLKTSRQVLQELAAEDNVVIIGRGANMLLRGHPNTLHIKLIADMPFRIRRVMEVRWVDENAAKEIIAKSDKNKAAYFQHVLHVDYNNSMLYDMVMRTDILGVERVVALLAGYFEHDAPLLINAEDKAS